MKIPLEFARPMTLLECSGYADAHREGVATYNEDLNRWIMNDGSGTWFGHQCYQDPDKILSFSLFHSESIFSKDLNVSCILSKQKF